MRALLVLALLLPGPRLAAQDAPQPQPAVPVIVTTGEAVVRRAPDRAFVTIAVETRAKSPRDAQRQNAEAMTSVLARLKAAFQLPGDSIRTLGYELDEEFDFIQNRRVSRGFIARNALEVRLDDIGRTGEVVDVAVQAGATSVTGIRFDVRDRESVEREALRLAVADGRARAEAAAAGAGRSLDRILRIEDQRQFQGPPRPMMAMAQRADAASTPVEPGAVEIRAQVTLTVSMK